MSDQPPRIVPTPTPDPASFRFSFPRDFPQAIFAAPALMSMQERLLLYTLVVGLQPERVLELGSFYGGSAVIMTAAMDGIDRGHIYAIDPEPRFSPEVERTVAHRLTMYKGFSPAALPEVAAAAGAPFDFAFVDADHHYESVVTDIVGILPYMADGAYILFHDAFFSEVHRGIDAAVSAHDDQLQDLGVLARSGGRAADILGPVSASVPDYEHHIADDSRIASEGTSFGGLRLLYFKKDGFGGALRSVDEKAAMDADIRASVASELKVKEMAERLRLESARLSEQVERYDALVRQPSREVTLRGLRQMVFPLGSRRFAIYHRLRGAR